ncbi:MAG: zinc ribbon domain-containing protein, partial [Clostridiales bacterium]|nr:zinc ribbon domain-containing protein [Clostridiales bacterium]
MIICSSCGKANEDGSKFCMNCGSPLPVEPVTNEEKVTSTPEPQAPAEVPAEEPAAESEAEAAEAPAVETAEEAAEEAAAEPEAPAEETPSEPVVPVIPAPVLAATA